MTVPNRISGPIAVTGASTSLAIAAAQDLSVYPTEFTTPLTFGDDIPDIVNIDGGLTGVINLPAASAALEGRSVMFGVASAPAAAVTVNGVALTAAGDFAVFVCENQQPLDGSGVPSYAWVTTAFVAT